MRARSFLVRAGLAAALAVSSLACFSFRGPADVREALDRQLGVGPHHQFGIRGGFFTTKLAGGILRMSSDEPASLAGLTGFQLHVYSLPADRKKSARGTVRPFELEGWTPIIHVRDKDSEVYVLAKQKGESIHGLMVVAEDDDEGQVVVARLRGKLERLVQVMSETARGHRPTAVEEVAQAADSD